MAIKIGHASSGSGAGTRVSGDPAGDQTGREVCTRTWYSSPWDTVLRFKDPAKAEKAARACEAGCANENIGYDQGNRNDAQAKAKAEEVGWDLSKIKTPTEVDCSSFMTLCAQCAGVDVPYVYGNAPYTGNMRAQFTTTGEFEVLTEAKYLNSDAYLKRGDILLNTKSHTAMALENGSRSSEQNNTPTATLNTPTTQVKIDPAYKFDKALAKTYTVTASALNLRSGADVSKPVLKVLPHGTRVTCYGYYNKKLDDVWLYVMTADGTTGYCSKKYLT